MTAMALAYIISVMVVMVAILVAAAMIASRHRNVVCPDNGQTVDVSCDPRGAIEAVFVGGHLRVTDCERWPEKADCDHGCEKQLLG